LFLKILNERFASQAMQQLSDKKKVKIIIDFLHNSITSATYCLKHQQQSSSDFSIEGIISCSENLTNRHREVIESFWCNPFTIAILLRS
jgi:hypothetical protein